MTSSFKLHETMHSELLILRFEALLPSRASRVAHTIESELGYPSR